LLALAPALMVDALRVLILAPNFLNEHLALNARLADLFVADGHYVVAFSWLHAIKELKIELKLKYILYKFFHYKIKKNCIIQIFKNCKILNFEKCTRILKIKLLYINKKL
jgi:hypothetical protein